MKPKIWKITLTAFRVAKEKKKKKGNETVVNSHSQITSQMCQPTRYQT